MKPQARKAHESSLRRLRTEILKKGPSRIEPNRRDAAEVGIADEDAQALSEMLQAIGSQRNRDQAALVARIDAALRRLRDDPDGYGDCEECGEAIAARRLQLMPWATLCTTCQSARDPQRGAPRRKVTDYT